MITLLCERCGKDACGFSMSFFNAETICNECDDIESAHPFYAIAVAAETQALLIGEKHFPGIGLPDMLRREARERAAKRVSEEVSDEC